jgi:hypothetical protein
MHLPKSEHRKSALFGPIPDLTELTVLLFQMSSMVKILPMDTLMPTV